MRIPVSTFPEHIIQQYNLSEKSQNGYVYVEIWQSIYGLPQAGALANKDPKENLTPHGYFEVTHTPGLWKHITRPIYLSLVVDDFGVKYVDKAGAEHHIAALKNNYGISKDWTGGLYWGITLRWNYYRYQKKQYVDISMPRYITKQLQK